ncbi:MAG: hypothetical protein ACMXYL_01640 [Candidatus Woesearchaeota archaeon]
MNNDNGISRIVEETAHSLIIEKDHARVNPNSRAPTYYVHLDESPWVEMQIDDHKSRRLETEVLGYNQRNPINWDITAADTLNKDNLTRVRLKIRPIYPIEDMHADITRIAEYFWKKL